MSENGTWFAYFQRVNSFINNNNYSFVGSLGSCVVAVQEPGTPQLRLSRTEDQVKISWPDDHSAFVLEMVDALSTPTRWRPMPGTAQNEVKVSLGMGTFYYRLARRKV